MTDVKLENAQVIWDEEGVEGEPSIKLIGVGSGKDDDRYSSSWGACNMDFNDASNEDRLSMLFQHFVHVVIADRIEAQAVHEAFMHIPEYRQALASRGTIDPKYAEPEAA